MAARGTLNGPSMLSTRHLDKLLNTLKSVHLMDEPGQLWGYVLERSCQALGAEGGSFFLVAPDGRMELTAAIGVDEERLRRVPLKVGTGICGWVAQNQEAVRIGDARSDSRFNPLGDQVTGRVTRSLLCVPVIFRQDTYGVVEIMNRREGSFAAEDQEFMEILGAQTAIAHQKLLLMRETLHTKVLLESLLLNMSGALIAADIEGNLTILNPSAKRLLHLTSDKVLGKPAAAILMEYPALLHILRQTLAGGEMVSRVETTFTVQGHAVRFGYSTILMRDPWEHILGSGVIFQKLPGPHKE
jgi:GAF domain-containing protein